MITYEHSPVRRLVQSLRRGGRVEAIAPLSGAEITGSALCRLILRHSKRVGKPTDCVSLLLVGFRINGSIDLSGQGLEGSPLIGLEFIDCEAVGELLLSYAYLKSLAFTAAKKPFVKTGSIFARGVTVVDIVRIRRLHMSVGSEIDFSESRLKGGVELIGLSTDQSSSVRGRTSGLRSVSFARSVVGSDIVIRGLNVSAIQPRAFDAEELKVDGSLSFGCMSDTRERFSPRCRITGELNIRGAKIGGQLLFEGILLSAHNVPKTVRHNAPPVFALMGEEAAVGGDVFFQEPVEQPTLGCRVRGQIAITGLTAGGEIHVFGHFDATKHRIRAFRAARINVKGDLRFGYAPGQDGKGQRYCTVLGECDFSGCIIGGKAIFSGSSHTITKDYTPPFGVIREQKQALHFKGASIGSELWFESGLTQTCRVEGLTLTRCKIGGRLIAQGAEFHAPRRVLGSIDPPIRKSSPKSSTPANHNASRSTTGKWRTKSISANGSTIRGGILLTARPMAAVTEDRQAAPRPTRLFGGVRLRNAVVDGPVQFSGVTMMADGSGLALWASNSRFGSDVLIQPLEGTMHAATRPKIRGELRLQGAHVRGRLWIQGVDLKAGKSGVALDCFTTEVDRSITLGSFCPGRVLRPGPPIPCRVQGLVSLVHLKAQSVTLGANPTSDIDKEADMLDMVGAILMRDSRLQSTVFIANACLRPAESLDKGNPLRHRMLKQLSGWGIYRESCVIHANYAVLGTRLFVRLLEGSHGLINLYAAKTGTIGGNTGSLRIKRATPWRRFSIWIKRRDHTPAVGTADSLRESWGKLFGVIHARDRGRPQKPAMASNYILLNIDEFVYDRTNDSNEHRQEYTLSFRRVLFAIAGRPSPAQLGPRYEWLRRIVENPGAQDYVVISAHRQLARVYREMGKLQQSYYYTRERRWLQICFGKLNWLQKGIDVAYSALFGFGYSPLRALGSLFTLWVISTLFVIAAISTPVDCRHVSQIDASAAWYTVAPLSSLKPATESKPDCTGALCEPEISQRTSGFHLPVTPFEGDVLSESAKLILPLPHLGAKTNLVLHKDAPGWLRMWLGLLSLGSWVLFPLAIGTVTGVLRESN